MYREPIRISREEMYEKVWSEPMTTLAARYGLSDVALRKKCRKLNIPVPNLGYWVKKQHGKAESKPPLPPHKGYNNVVEIRSTLDEYSSADHEQYPEAEKSIAFELNEENKIQVSSVLTSPHPLVARTRNSRKGGKTAPAEETKGDLDISVSSDSLDRVLRIMDALIKALEKRGFEVSVISRRLPGYHYDHHITQVDVFGVPLEFDLKERYNQIERKPAKDKKETSWLDPKFDLVPSSRLTLSIKTYSGEGVRRTWTDGEKQKLEDCLNNFIVNLIKSSVVIQAKEAARQRKERERQENERRRAERAKKIHEEKIKVQSLIKETENWKLSQHIREYVEAIRNKVTKVKGPIEPGSEIDQWLIWAGQQADRLDPLVKSPSSILDEED